MHAHGHHLHSLVKKRVNRPIFSQIRSQEQAEPEGQLGGCAARSRGTFLERCPCQGSCCALGQAKGTHPLQELRPLLLLVTTSCCCYFVFLPAPFPPLLFLIQLKRDGEAQVRASRCRAGQEVGVSTRQPHPWQGKERGGSHPCQWPPVTWSNPHQKQGVLLPQPLTPLRRDTGRQYPQLGTQLAGDRQLFAGLLPP